MQQKCNVKIRTFVAKKEWKWVNFFYLFQSFSCRHNITMIRHKFELIVTLVLICFTKLSSTSTVCNEIYNNNNNNSNNTYIATNCSDVSTTDRDVYETSLSDDDDDRILSRQKRDFGGREPIDYVKVSISPTFFEQH